MRSRTEITSEPGERPIDRRARREIAEADTRAWQEDRAWDHFRETGVWGDPPPDDWQSPAQPPTWGITEGEPPF